MVEISAALRFREFGVSFKIGTINMADKWSRFAIVLPTSQAHPPQHIACGCGCVCVCSRAIQDADTGGQRPAEPIEKRPKSPEMRKERPGKAPHISPFGSFKHHLLG